MDKSSDIDEDRMRAILRLPRSASASASAARGGRRRFVRDGDVPVVMVNPRHDPPEQDREAAAELERALASEREARLAAEKALHQARETIRQLQTRLAHAEIAGREAAPPPAPPTPPAQEAPPPKRLRQRAPEPEPREDEAVEWWKPGWKERFRARRG